MNLIKDCAAKKDASGKLRRYAIFFCEYCESTVERRKDAGLRALSCGCVSNVLNNDKGKRRGCFASAWPAGYAIYQQGGTYDWQ